MTKVNTSYVTLADIGKLGSLGATTIVASYVPSWSDDEIRKVMTGTDPNTGKPRPFTTAEYSPELISAVKSEAARRNIDTRSFADKAAAGLTATEKWLKEKGLLPEGGFASAIVPKPKADDLAMAQAQAMIAQDRQKSQNMRNIMIFGGIGLAIVVGAMFFMGRK